MQLIIFSDMTEDEMASYFENRHAQEVSESRNAGNDTYDDISQNSLLPTTRDPGNYLLH